MSDTQYQVISMGIYFVAMIIIGLWAYRRTSTVDDYMLGGRQLNPMTAALSAGASDMSGWLLMGLPGALYATGLVEFWIAIGLTVGAWVNWWVVAPRLRSYTEVSNNSITVPSFLDSRLRDRSHALRLIAGVIILFFFTFYVSSGLVAAGTFFEGAFEMDYRQGMLIITIITLVYTLIGGFLAVSYTDVVQGLMMLVALILIPIVGIMHVGGPGEVIDAVRDLDPTLLNPMSGSIIALISALAWGLGYFGQPHIIVRFMALRNPAEATSARRIGIGWMFLSVLGALGTAFVGIALFQHSEAELANPEQVFIVLGQLLFHPLIAGFMLAAILAAIMSTVSSQLLVSSSALVEDVYMIVTKKNLSREAGMNLSRIAVALITVIACVLAWTPSDTILNLVGFAWAGFGASFGPTILLALFWRKLSAIGAVSGMVVGALTVVLWGNIDGSAISLFGSEINPFDLYEIVPGFILNLIVAIIVSRLTYRHNTIIDAEFEAAKDLAADWSDHKTRAAEIARIARENADGYKPRSATITDALEDMSGSN